MNRCRRKSPALKPRARKAPACSLDRAKRNSGRKISVRRTRIPLSSTWATGTTWPGLLVRAIHVRFWHLADIPNTPAFVRCWGTADNGRFWLAVVCPLMSSRPEESHPRALPDPCVNLSIHTAPDVQPLAHAASSFTSSTGSSCCQLASVGPWPRLNNAAPSLQPHYRTFITTTGCSAPVLRIGTLVLTVLAA